MKSNLENISDTKKKIKLTVPVHIVEESYKDAFKTVGKKANVPGFRKGKIPEHMLSKFYGSDIEMESLNILVQNTYSKVLEEHKLVPVLKPKFDVKPLSRGTDYEYTVELEVKPQFELKEYIGLKVAKKEAKATEEEINQELAKLQEQKAELKPAPEGSELKDGFVASLDFAGTIDGVAFEGGTTKGFILEYGKGRFLKEFEDQILGQKVGEERTIQVTFPENYAADVAGKKAQFVVKVEALYTKESPKLDDEFAKDLGKENLAQLKTEAEEQIKARHERSFKRDYADAITELLLKDYDFEIPEGLIEEDKKNQKDRSEDDIKKSIKLQFILESIAEKEAIKVNPQDLDMRFRQMAMIYRQPVDAIKQYYHQNNMIPGMVAQIVMEKTLDLLVDKATLQ